MLEFKALPYSYESLKPIISSETFFFHYEKHYAGYVSKANELIPQKWGNKHLIEIISLAQKNKEIALFNQAAQVWNHEFFFSGLSLNPSDQIVSNKTISLIQQDFRSLENLKAEIIKAATSRFGSGWVWLFLENGHLKIQTTSNAETICTEKSLTPLWVLDIWEHAYYLDYQNRRSDYATEVVNNAMNWHFIENNLGF